MLGFSVLACLAAMSAAQSSQFQILSLPGFAGTFNFNYYGGYITVDKVAGRALYFQFAEASEVAPASAPLVVWFTGGPGCSSLMAQFTEQGPFAVGETPGTIELNPWSWNRKANVLWIESPAGVGFSYSNTTSDYNVGDARTTADATAFLQSFLFDFFPQFKHHAVWFTGESYGGHYVPLATWAAYSTRSSARPINVKGMMVGNAWTDAANDNAGCLDQWWTHALIDEASTNAVKAACNLSHIGPLAVSQAQPALLASCSAAVNNVQSVAFADINIYDIYADECNVNSQFADHVIHQLSEAGSIAHRILAAARKKSRKRQMDPCTQNNLQPYLNDPVVQQAINALPTQWTACSSIVNYDRTSILTSVLPTYAKLFAAKLHVMIYSGDVDGIVPFLGTVKNVAALAAKQSIVKSWRNWFVSDQYGAQVGGFVTQYDSFTFATVRNAGHMVPMYQPRRAYYMFAGFLHNQTLPTTNPFN